jgi:hypothetical protein
MINVPVHLKKLQKILKYSQSQKEAGVQIKEKKAKEIIVSKQFFAKKWLIEV